MAETQINKWNYCKMTWNTTLPWQECSYHINCTCCKFAIYGQIIKSGAMMGIEIFKFQEHTMLASTLEKIC